jgi:hypothetical protein
MSYNLQISPVQRTHSPLRFLWPIQSLSQFVSFALSCIVILTIIAGALHLWGPPWMSPPIVLLFAALGATWSLFSVLPAKIEMNTPSEARFFVKDVSETITDFNYGDGVPSGDGSTLCRRFVHKGPRWQRVLESEITLTAQDHTIELRGPVVMLRLIRRRLEKDATRQRGIHA